MSGIGRYKLSDAIGRPAGGASGSKSRKARAKEEQRMAAEQAREALESSQAKDAEASIRGHMVEIGRGNQQAGRQQSGGRKGK